MGIYAEAAMWAEMNGRDPSDMSPEDWMSFYDEADTPPRRRPRNRHKCKTCGRRFRSPEGLNHHQRDKGHQP